MHTAKPFSLATQRAAADEVAVIHYEWIKRTLEQSGVVGNSFNIAMAWNCGVEAVLSGRAPNVSYNYAERVANLVETIKDSERSTVVRESQTADLRPVLRTNERDDGLQFRVLQDTPRFVIAAG
jgi:hypothetical protein